MVVSSFQGIANLLHVDSDDGDTTFGSLFPGEGAEARAYLRVS